MGELMKLLRLIVPRIRRFPAGAFCAALAGLCGALTVKGATAPPDFSTQIQPLLQKHCIECHGPEKQKGGLRLDTRGDAFRPGDSKQPAITALSPERSPLIERLKTKDPDKRMPPKADPLAAAEIALLERWVREGASWPDDTEPVAKRKREMVVTEVEKGYWAFRPLRTTGSLSQLLPRANFEKSLTAQASRRTLIRRAYFDLIGLPPTPEEVDAFQKDSAPDAYERLVDRLLASRNYGERWGRHWLDLARYADSDGYESDQDRPEAWRYRDWVIRALNADMPFDRFVRWQLAGDEYEPNNPDAVAATGFLTAGPIADTTPADTEENKLKIRYDELDDMLATTGSAMLGLTVGCARCHDHKYDPIPTRDYYRMLAAFQTARRANTFLSKPHREREKWLTDRHREMREALMTDLSLTDEQKFWLRQPEHFFVPIQVELYKKYGAKLKTTDAQLRAWLPEEQRRVWDGLNAAVANAEIVNPNARVKALIAFDERPEAQPAFLLGRGNVMDRARPVSFGVLQVLQRGRTPEDYLAAARGRASTAEEVGAEGFVSPPTTYQRKAMAEWLTDADQGAGPLLARVIVNRLWQHHFGEGLAPSPSDFGTQGGAPSQPELLDALAAELIRQGWRLKPIHRLIMTSEFYTDAGEASGRGKTAPKDPSRRLPVIRPARRPIRLEAEVLRDSMLAVSGRLNRKMFGPPFRPMIPKEAIATRSKDPYPSDIQDGVELWRRSVYAFVKRSVSNPLMEVFDAPDSNASCGRRNTTTVPTQALTLMNDDFVRQCATQFAQRVITEAGLDATAQIRRAYRIALGREPRPRELENGRRFLGFADDAKGEGIAVDGLTDFCHVLLTLNEFIYVD